MRLSRPETKAGVLAGLALAVLLCYANALDVPFHFDDYNVIVNNPRVHSWASWLEGLTLGIRPLLKFSYLLNWRSATDVSGFHLLNMLLHLANATLVYLLAQAFVRPQRQADALQAAPFLTALLFAVHPIHTEAVTYICGRSTSMMTLFYLAGLYSYISGRMQQNQATPLPLIQVSSHRRRPVFRLLKTLDSGLRRNDGLFKIYALTPLLFIAALSVKETAVTFPLALLLWESVCSGKWRAALKAQWPSWLVLVLSALIFVFSASYSSQIERSAGLNSLQGNAATQLSAIAYLMRQWALPLWLNIDPDLPLQRDFSAALLPLLFFAALFVFMLSCWRKRPWISLALAWTMLQLLPLHLLLPRLDIANDRQMYLAGWPLLLALSIELTLCLNSRAFRLTAAALVLTLGGLTVLRNQVYASEIRLWEDTVMKSPDKARGHNNLGYAYLLVRRHNDARREFVTALQLDPKLYKARYNLYRVDEEIGASHERAPGNNTTR